MEGDRGTVKGPALGCLTVGRYDPTRCKQSLTFGLQGTCIAYYAVVDDRAPCFSVQSTSRSCLLTCPACHMQPRLSARTRGFIAACFRLYYRDGAALGVTIVCDQQPVDRYCAVRTLCCLSKTSVTGCHPLWQPPVGCKHENGA